MYFGFNNEIIREDVAPALLWQHLRDIPPMFINEIFVAASKVTFWQLHYEYFYRVADKLNILLPDFFVAYKDFIRRLVNRNKFFNGSVAKILFYPYQNEMAFLAFPRKTTYRQFEVNYDKFYNIEVVENEAVIRDSWSFVIKNDIHNYIYKEKPLFYLENNYVVGTQYFGLIVIKGKTIYSPTWQAGFKFNPLQLVVNDILKKFGYDIKDDPVPVDFITNADELFLVDRVYGIYNRIGWGENRYYISDLADKVIYEVNRFVFNELS